MNKKKLIGTIILIVLCAVMVALIYCQRNSLLFFAADSAAPGGMPSGFPGGGFPGGARSGGNTTAVNVSVKEMRQENFEKSVIINGEIVGDVSEKNITADVSGTIKEIYVERGSVVKAGDPIALIDPSTPGVNYKARTIVSPIDGTVTNVNVYVNQSASSQTVLVSIGEPSALIMTMYVPERYYRYLEKGTSASFTTIAYPDETYSAVVRYVDSSINANTRTVKVELDITTESEHLLAGMFVRARLITEKVEDAIIVPTSAISTYLGNKVVYCVENGKAVRKVVEVGTADDNNSVIVSGLNLGDKVVISGTVSDGSSVNIVSEN